MPKDPVKAARASELWRTSEEYRQKSRDRKKKWYKRQRELDSERISKLYSEYRLASLDKIRERHLKKKYGLDWNAFNKLKENQNNSCAICGAPFADYSETRVDHCHESNKVRGILCHGCNVGLGYFYDNADALRRAADYLDKANE